jgi:hypothetical protein
MRTCLVFGLVAALAVGCGSNNSLPSDGGGGNGGTSSGGGGAAGGGSTGTAGAIGAAGATGAGGSGGQTGMACGGIAGVTCSVFDWCDFPGDTCGAGDVQGHCRDRNDAGYDCTTPVCGCNGKTYGSACDAHKDGVDAVSTKSCIPGNGGSGAACAVDGDCKTGFKCCAIFGRVGSPIACTQVAAGQECPAYP